MGSTDATLAALVIAMVPDLLKRRNMSVGMGIAYASVHVTTGIRLAAFFAWREY